MPVEGDGFHRLMLNVEMDLPDEDRSTFVRQLANAGNRLERRNEYVESARLVGDYLITLHNDVGLRPGESREIVNELESIFEERTGETLPVEGVIVFGST